MDNPSIHTHVDIAIHIDQSKSQKKRSSINVGDLFTIYFFVQIIYN